MDRVYITPLDETTFAFFTDWDKLHYLRHHDNRRHDYIRIERYKNALYVGEIRYRRPDRADLHYYPVTQHDWDYCRDKYELAALHPERRLLDMRDLDHAPVEGYWQTSTRYARVLRTTLFTVLVECLDKETTLLFNQEYSYWEFMLLYERYPEAESHFIVAHLSKP